MFDRTTPQKHGPSNRCQLPVAAGVLIPAGTIVMVCVDGDFGSVDHAYPGSAEAGLSMVGVACRRADNTEGQDGDVWVEAESGRAYLFDNCPDAPVMARHLRRTCCVVDGSTVSNGHPGVYPAGIVWAVEDDGVWVFI